MPHFATLKFSNATFCDIKKILMLRFETLKLFFNAYYSSFKLINILTKSANGIFANLQIADK